MTALSEDELPLTLPKMKEIRPSQTGESPLANNLEWLEVVDPVTGKKGRRKRIRCRTGPEAAGITCATLIQTIAKLS